MILTGARDKSRGKWPDCVEAAVAWLLSRLSEEDKATIRATAEEDLSCFHHGWGCGIRQHGPCGGAASHTV